LLQVSDSKLFQDPVSCLGSFVNCDSIGSFLKIKQLSQFKMLMFTFISPLLLFLSNMSSGLLDDYPENNIIVFNKYVKNVNNTFFMKHLL